MIEMYELHLGSRAAVLAIAILLCAAGDAACPAGRPPEVARPLRFLALGDSYTIGQGVAARERWPERLVDLLTSDGVRVDPPQVIARTGWTTAELRAALAAAAPRGPFDLVTVMVGVNDQFRGQAPAHYDDQLRRLLGEAVALAGGRADHVLVLSIPDYGVTPFARRGGDDPAVVAAEIDRFNAIARQAAVDVGARWIDVTPSSRRAAADRSLLAGDGLHPSATMHATWAELVRPIAAAVLAAR